jgi:hypothetical protein
MNTRHGPDADVSGLLQVWEAGDVEARDRLFPLVSQELRRRAAEYLRLVTQDRTAWRNRALFLGVGAQMMRCILVSGATVERQWQARAWLYARLARAPQP